MKAEVINLHTRQPQAAAPVPSDIPVREEERPARVEYESTLIDLSRDLAAMVKAIAEQAFRAETAEAGGRDPVKERFLLLCLLDAATPIADAILKIET